MKEFQNAYIKEIVVEGMPGSTVHESVNEVFAWFYDQKITDKCIMPHVNGVTITFERHEVK